MADLGESDLSEEVVAESEGEEAVLAEGGGTRDRGLGVRGQGSLGNRA